MANLRIVHSSSSFSVPIFLAPMFASSIPSFERTFSTSSCRNKRATRDKNRKRGVSAIRSTGPRQTLLSSYKFPTLPTPRPESERPLKDFPTKQDHGLYGFFNEKRLTLIPPEDEEAHGRAWTYQELMQKSFDDLHALYWVGIKELNQIATRSEEHKRLHGGFGESESTDRKETVEETNKNIRKVLRDRQYLYEEARMLLQSKSPQDLLEEQPDFEEEEVMDTSEKSETNPSTSSTQTV